jgi:hypothetical protein
MRKLIYFLLFVFFCTWSGSAQVPNGIFSIGRPSERESTNGLLPIDSNKYILSSLFSDLSNKQKHNLTLLDSSFTVQNSILFEFSDSIPEACYNLFAITNNQYFLSSTRFNLSNQHESTSIIQISEVLDTVRCFNIQHPSFSTNLTPFYLKEDTVYFYGSLFVPFSTNRDAFLLAYVLSTDQIINVKPIEQPNGLGTTIYTIKFDTINNLFYGLGSAQFDSVNNYMYPLLFTADENFNILQSVITSDTLDGFNYILEQIEVNKWIVGYPKKHTMYFNPDYFLGFMDSTLQFTFANSFHQGSSYFTFSDAVKMPNSTNIVLTHGRNLTILDSSGQIVSSRDNFIGNQFPLSNITTSEMFLKDNKIISYGRFSYNPGPNNTIIFVADSMGVTCSSFMVPLYQFPHSFSVFNFPLTTVPNYPSLQITGIGYNLVPITPTSTNLCSILNSIAPDIQPEQISVSPNPVDESVTISLNINDSEIIHLQIYSLSGQLITDIVDFKNNDQLNLGYLTPGLYILTAKTENKFKFYSKIVKL